MSLAWSLSKDFDVVDVTLALVLKDGSATVDIVQVTEHDVSLECGGVREAASNHIETNQDRYCQY